MHPFFHVFGRAVPAYGSMVVLGAVAAWLAARTLAGKKGVVKKFDATCVFLMAVAGGVAGAVLLRPIIRTVEVFIGWDTYRYMLAGDLLGHIFGEIVFYGGLLGGLGAIALFCRLFKLKLIPVLDFCAPGVATAHMIGRVGCFLGGCCFGIEISYTHPLAVVYPAHSLSAPAGVPLLAVPLIEASILFILAAGLSVLYLKSKIAGLSTAVYMIGYGAARFVLEYFRGDIIRGQYGPFTTSQYISIALFAAGIVILAMSLRRPGRGTG